MSGITELEGQIRELINAPRKHRAVSEDPRAYDKLCSCLDVIGDTELAFCAHQEMADEPAPGSSYILAYGLLQALFLQQDAVRHLCEALQLPWEPDPLLTEIRELRNDAVGHPTNRRGGESFSYISRPSIAKSGFQLMTVEPGTARPPILRSFSFRSLLDTQRAQLKKALAALLEALRKEEMGHRAQYRDQKLLALFPPKLSYWFEKVYGAARGSAVSEVGEIHLSMIREVVEGFKAALEKREIAGAYSRVEDQLERLEYPLAQLSEYFAAQGRGRLNANDAEVFTFFLQHGMSGLKGMAAELDEEYASELE